MDLGLHVSVISDITDEQFEELKESLQKYLRECADEDFENKEISFESGLVGNNCDMYDYVEYAHDAISDVIADNEENTKLVVNLDVYDIDTGRRCTQTLKYGQDEDGYEGVISEKWKYGIDLHGTDDDFDNYLNGLNDNGDISFEDDANEIINFICEDLALEREQITEEVANKIKDIIANS